MNRDVTPTEATGVVERETDVLIVGAGPTGLVLAIELQRRGIDYRLIERADATVETSQALGINPRTLQVFDDLGTLDRILAEGFRLAGQTLLRGDRQLARIDTDSVETGDRYPYLWILPQNHTERALVDRLTALGGAVEFERELRDFDQDEAGVIAWVAHLDDPEEREERITATWLVGCDGGHSEVRKTLGLGFEGETRPETFLLADAVVDADWPPREALTWFHDDGVFAALPLTGRNRWRLFVGVSADEADRAEPTLDDLQSLLETRTGDEEARIREVVWTSMYTVNQRLVESYRSGRVFLAGDAAHVHSPFGAMGMNTGIQDAYNLGWKLALVVDGRAGPSLLDTYEGERRPIAAAVLDSTGPTTGLVASTNPIVEGFRDHVLGPLLSVTAVQSRLLAPTTQLGIDYRDGPLSVESGPSPLDGLRESASLGSVPANGWQVRRAPRAGDRLLDADCHDPDGSATSLYEHRHGETGFALLLFTGPRGSGHDEAVEVATAVTERLGGLVRPSLVVPDGTDVDSGTAFPVLLDVDGALHRRYGAPIPAAYLIRPDDYVGFRGVPTELDPILAYLEDRIGLVTEAGAVTAEN